MGVLGGIGLFRRRFFWITGGGGLHWRALVLQFAKWPYQARGHVAGVTAS
jgi:hypothetical protein